MRVTVLGKSPSWEDAGGACSGYLLEEGDAALLLECGNGVFSKLRGYRDYCEIDAVVVSHMHADHFLDLIPYSYALTFSPRQQPVPVDRWQGTSAPARPKLHLPSGGREMLRRIVGSWGNESLVEEAFEIREYGSSDKIQVGSLNVRFHPVPHFCNHTYAVEVASSKGGGRLTYGSDHAPNDAVVEFARDTDLLILEATLPRPERDGHRGHMTPDEAGEHARMAGARRLVLSHISDELDELTVVKRAGGSFGGGVEVAHEGSVYVL